MKKRRVIIADSSQNLLEGIRCLMNTIFDYVVMVADMESMLDSASGMDADLVICDLSLGAGRLEQAIDSLKTISPRIKVMLLSIYDEPAAIREAISSGADGLVFKRSAAEDLIPAVEKIMAGGTFFSAVHEK